MAALEEKGEMIPLPGNITSILRGLWSVGTIKAAVNLKLFDAMADGPATPEEIAAFCKIDLKAAEIMARALAGLDLLKLEKNNSFSLSEEAGTYLVSDQPLYLGHYIQVHSKIQEHWSHLETVAKTGEPVSRVNESEDAQSFFPDLAASLFAMNYAHASQVADFFKEKLREQREHFNVLDLACGSGVWSIPMAKESRAVKVDALDFPGVIEVTRSFAEKNGVLEQFNFLSGDWRDIEMEDEKYDLIFLGHILHSEGREDSEALLDKLVPKLRKGGHIVIAEFVIDECGTKPASVSMFAINMYILTSKGCVFSESELKELLDARGFENMRRLGDVPFESLILMAQKA